MTSRSPSTGRAERGENSTGRAERGENSTGRAERGENSTGRAERGEARLVASVLPADFAELGRDVAQIEHAGVDRIQWDVMDGRFVPNLTFGPDVIAACRPKTGIGFEAHLMVEDPDPMLARWVDAGCDIVIVHVEACRHLHRTLCHIRDLGARAGVALNPATPLSAVVNVLDVTDLLLVMTVNPGFGGQRYLSSMEPKIAAARAEIDRRELDVELEVDGGIGPETIARAALAGADVFCAGSALFTGSTPMSERADALRAAASGIDGMLVAR